MSSENSNNLRIEFVGMMFALAIAQVGIEIAEFFEKGISLWNHFYVITHLSLSTYVIASSWVGWQSSASKNKLTGSGIFNLSFIVLLIDIIIVIFYFILVRGVEKPTCANKIPECRTEIIWSIIIFCSYFLWDLITAIPEFKFKSFITRSYQSIICIALAFYLFFFFSSKTSVSIVILVDLILISAFILFRGLKDVNIFSDIKRKTLWELSNFKIYIPIVILTVLLVILNLK